MVAILALATGARCVGSGRLELLHESGEPAATSGSAVTVEVFRPNPGDAWPAPGQLGLRLHAENIPAFAPNADPVPGPRPNTMWLIRLYGPAEELPALPWSYRSCDEIKGDGIVSTGIKGAHTITLTPARVLDALITIDDTPENWRASWVLTTMDNFANFAGAYAVRCGTITVPPP
jgi:hypothetical protein